MVFGWTYMTIQAKSVVIEKRIYRLFFIKLLAIKKEQFLIAHWLMPDTFCGRFTLQWQATEQITHWIKLSHSFGIDEQNMHMIWLGANNQSKSYTNIRFATKKSEKKNSADMNLNKQNQGVSDLYGIQRFSFQSDRYELHLIIQRERITWVICQSIFEFTTWNFRRIKHRENNLLFVWAQFLCSNFNYQYFLIFV